MKTPIAWSLSLVLMPALASFAPAQELPQERDRSPNHRSRATDGERTARRGTRPARPGGMPARFPDEFRSVDGSGNNLRNPAWGAAGELMRRWIAADYADGVEAPAGATRPSARVVSNQVVDQEGSILNRRGASDFLWMWGQFLDHDLTETPIADPAEPFDIEVPAGDPWFDPTGSGIETIPLDRSAYEYEDGVRQQVNHITAYIDASNVYGSDAVRALALRAMDGSGRLATSAGDYLPYNVAGLPNAPDPSAAFFLAGDIRANEQVALIAMHTLFVREHNRLADQLAARGTLSGDAIYSVVRELVAAQMQVITYREFLPALLGRDALRSYRGYRSEVDASIVNVFATAAYRFGHTMLSSQLLRLESDGSVHAAGHLSLAGAFFNPSALTSVGLEPYLRGLAAQTAQDVDPFLIDEVRNLLFGPPGSGGLDLAALNIQRGRDHGLPGYNDLRAAAGRGRARSMADVSRSSTIQSRLRQTYGRVDEIDPWVGLVSEDHVRGALVGPTLRILLADQFERLRDGDRFWYQTYLPTRLVQWLESQTLADVIRRNTSIGAELQDDVFRVRRSGGGR